MIRMRQRQVSVVLTVYCLPPLIGGIGAQHAGGSKPQNMATYRDWHG